MQAMLESGLQTVMAFPGCSESNNNSGSLLQVKTSSVRIIHNGIGAKGLSHLFRTVVPLEDTLLVPHEVAIVFTFSIILGICIVYRGHGVYGLAIILTQIAAIITTQLSNKALLDVGFKYPVTLNSFHFICVFITIACWRIYVIAAGERDRLSVMFEDRESCMNSGYVYVRRLAPIAFMQTLAVGCNTASLLYLDAGFNALIGILAPVVTAMVAVALGSSISGMGWFGITLAIVGDGLVAIEGTRLAMENGSAYGLVLLGIGLGVSAMLVKSIRTVLIDTQMNVYEGDADCPKLSPLELAALLSPLIMCLGILNALIVEGFSGYKELLAPWNMSFHAGSLLFLSSVCAVYLTIMGFYLVKLLGASAAQIAIKLNILVTIALSSAFLGESLSILEIIGAITVLVGATIFEQSPKPSTPEKKEGS
jgi:drug/metabolite transporter (DMT)-like permease